jgi:hypothetical protein
VVAHPVELGLLGLAIKLEHLFLQFGLGFH